MVDKRWIISLVANHHQPSLGVATIELKPPRRLPNLRFPFPMPVPHRIPTRISYYQRLAVSYFPRFAIYASDFSLANLQLTIYGIANHHQLAGLKTQGDAKELFRSKIFLIDVSCAFSWRILEVTLFRNQNMDRTNRSFNSRGNCHVIKLHRLVANRAAIHRLVCAKTGKEHVQNMHDLA